MKKLVILFLACLFTNVALISAYDHPIDGSCKPPHKGKGCAVCCCIDHISAASEASGNSEILELFNFTNGVNFGGPGPFVFTLTFQDQLTKSGDSITLLLKPNTFLFQCPGQYCVEFSGCAEAEPTSEGVQNTVIVFLVNGEILQPIDQRFVFTGLSSSGNRLSCFFKSAVVEVSDEVSCTNPFPFQVAFKNELVGSLEANWQDIHYSIKITHITDSKCEIAPLNP